MTRRVLGLIMLAAAIIAAGAAGARGLRTLVEATTVNEGAVPTAMVRRGDVTITVTARGEIQGGGAETLVTPMSGAAELAIVELRQTGERVFPGDVVVAFDTTQQEYEIREAEANLQEAEQEVIKARAETQAALEEARYQAAAAAIDVQIAEQEMRRNEVLPAVEQRENEIALERAQNRLRQAQENLESRRTGAGAAVQLRRAAVTEAARLAEAARQAIGNMTLKAETEGYVHVLENRNGMNILFSGMSLPQFQVGDAARPGQPVVQIPNLSRWEVSAEIAETDRGYLQIGQAVEIQPAAVPGRKLGGRIVVLGGTTGSAWSRAFTVRIALDESDPGLRPGMSATVQIAADSLEDVLWIPSQALFENDGRSFVYEQADGGYVTREVTLTRRSESQAVITGIEEGAVVALARPGRPNAPASGSADGVMGALPQ